MSKHCRHTDQITHVVPSALDVLHPGRVAVLFEGGAAAVAAQVETTRRLVGGAVADASVWEESRSRQEAALGRARFEPRALREVLTGLPEAVVRVAAGVAYVPEALPNQTPDPVRLLQERVRERFDPQGVLA